MSIPPPTSIVSFRSMAMAHRLPALAVVGILGVVLTSSVMIVRAEGVRTEARLQATRVDGLASGKARYEQRNDRVRMSIEVEDVATASAVRFDVNGVTVGVRSIRFGAADLNLDSRRGDAIPSLSGNDIVQVLDADTGALLLSANLP